MVKAKSWAGEYVDASVSPTLASDVVEIVHSERNLEITELRDIGTQCSVRISSDLEISGATLAGCVGFKYFVRRGKSDNTQEVRLLEKAGDSTVTQRVVTGLAP